MLLLFGVDWRDGAPPAVTTGTPAQAAAFAAFQPQRGAAAFDLAAPPTQRCLAALCNDVQRTPLVAPQALGYSCFMGLFQRWLEGRGQPFPVRPERLFNQKMREFLRVYKVLPARSTR